MIGSESRYRLVRQLEQADCGPAALLSVLRWYGGDVELVDLREWCSTDSHGTTLLDLQRAAQRCGFVAQGARGSYDDLSRTHLPCIVHLVEADALHHYGVVYRVTRRRVVLGDPGQGVRRVPRRDFCRLWAKGAVLLLTPTSNLLQRPVLHWWRWIASYLFSQRAWIQQSVFLGLLITLLGLMTALFVQTLIDRHIPAGDSGHILYAGMIVLLLLLLRAGLGLVRAFFLVSLNQRITLAMTRDFIERLFRLPRSFFERRKTGDITARINDSLKIHQAVLLFSHSVILDSLVVLGSLSLMATYSQKLALLCLAGLPLYAVLVAIGSRRVRDENRAVLTEHARVESD
ncbi:hypothetical protein JW992_07980, partial [candidate division KSB1 bacterium]|nr:hypothetical protein [candidate division KSB1 bacterium]